MREVDRFIEEKIEEGYFPGCVLLVGNREEVLHHKAYGYSEIIPARRKMKEDSIFDIASITKPLATTTATLLLIDEGTIGLQDTIGSILDELQRTQNGNATIIELLTHTSMIPSWYPLYLISRDERDICEFIGNLKANKKAYSCLDYILLGKAIERLTGETLKQFTEKHIFKPMGMGATCYCPSGEQKNNIAATETGNKHEKELSMKYGGKESFPWRENTIIGEVHDGNSFYCFDGVSGNAGVFSTASDLSIFAQCILNGGNDVLKPEIEQNLLNEGTKENNEARSLG
ncbi:MAG: hypothetical protein E3J78_02605, partial [Candidatus Cloacimonadota bacterium]